MQEVWASVGFGYEVVYKEDATALQVHSYGSFALFSFFGSCAFSIGR
jgi:hypothetical protein